MPVVIIHRVSGTAAMYIMVVVTIKCNYTRILAVLMGHYCCLIIIIYIAWNIYACTHM